MIDLLQAAANNDRNEDYTFSLEGDLCQMSAQADFLRRRGFDIKQNNVYPCIKEKDKKKALTLIWDQRCEGWHHYEKQYVEFGICTSEEFRHRLGVVVKQKREDWENGRA